MRIGELAAATGTTNRALRYYEQEGLLHSDRTPAGYRDYPEHTELRVRNIRELLAIGFTVSDVRGFLDYLDKPLPPAFVEINGCATAVQIARQRIDRLRDRIETLTRLHDSLAARLDPH
ncbi:MerR family transcriptional regulator [Micromonospora sp. 067-2]|uniref:MerR family transcriptional regulator n=1 Tax=Micromonospora sp. 067-2 TaxID=2789270 RepID=UPI00397B3E64